MPGADEQRLLHRPTIAPDKAREIAVEAYIYGYPLVLFDVTRQTFTNVTAPCENGAPMNQFCNKRRFPNHTSTTVIGANADTLYSSAFLDVSKEAVVLSLPNLDNRYYLMQLLDAWTNVFASVGTRTTGNVERDFVITGPKGAGELPSGIYEIKSPTDLIWIIGRTQTNGKSDYAAVHEIQDKYKLTPLSAFGGTYTPPANASIILIDMKVPSRGQLTRMNATAFFSRLNSLMRNNPPNSDDAEAIRRFSAIGVVPGRPFDLRSKDPAVAREIADGVREAKVRIAAESQKTHGANRNGWDVVTNLGRYGTDYLFRAVTAFVGLGANLPEDAIYPRAATDSDGQLLSGEKRYEITFAKGQLPPVQAFWSITMYNEQQLFVPNSLNRYAIGDRDRIEFNHDGSLTLYIQNDSPGKARECNWLPAPKGRFNLCMRLYWPNREIIDGSWKPPLIRRKRAEVKQIA